MKKGLAALLTAALLPLALISAPAQAVGFTDPVIVSPTGTVANGQRGTVKINFAAAPAGSYSVTLTAADYSTYEYSQVTYDGVTDLVTVPLSAAPLASGRYTIDVTNYMEQDVSGTFTVAAPLPPALALSNVSISPTTFYPRVRDAYRDTTTMRYTLNRSARVVARVLTTGGTVIRTVELGTRRGYSWAWDGRKNNRALAAAGNYNIKITSTVTAAPASTRSVVRRVRLATGYTFKPVTKRRTGSNTSSTSHSSSCYIDRAYYSSTVDMDCWGGAYAKASYGFTIPSNAYRITWGVSGSQGCCTSGVISKTGARPTRTSYGVSVKVTNWRSYTVQSVRVTYSYKRRI